MEVDMIANIKWLPKRPDLNNADRFLFVWLYHWFPSVLGAVAIVRPETIIRWHRVGFRAHWRWRSRNRVGRPKVSTGPCHVAERGKQGIFIAA
jgi:hypothetical protein